MAVVTNNSDYSSAVSALQKQKSGTQPVTSRTNQTLNSLSNLANATPYQFTSAQPFSYNKDTDPAYQAALASARENITQGQADTNAKLRAGGQGKSSYSESVANQISAKELGKVSTDVLPSLIEQAYTRYADQSNRDLQTQQLNYGARQDQMSQLASLYGLQNQQDFQNPLAESQVTGKYLSGDASNAIQQLLGLKQTAESGSNGASYQGQGDALRGYLQSLGIDISGLGADVSYADAVKNAANLGTNTLAQRQANLAAAQSVGQDRGQLLEPVDDWRNLYYQNGLGANYTAQRANAADQQWQQQFQSGEDQRAIGNQLDQDQLALQRQQAMASIANSYADNSRQDQAAGRAATQQQMSNLMDIWQLTGVAPSGLEAYGITSGTPLAVKASSNTSPNASSYKTNPEYAADVQALRADPKQQQLLNTNPQSFITAYGYDGYLALRKEFGLDKSNTDMSTLLIEAMKQNGGE